MPSAGDKPTLSDRHYVTLILRLTLDQVGDVINGELVDTANSLPEHFIGITGLHQAMEAWFQQQHSKREHEP
jgi:hypothetical protein